MIARTLTMSSFSRKMHRFLPGIQWKNDFSRSRFEVSPCPSCTQVRDTMLAHQDSYLVCIQ